ncbi:hypothetical protein [Halosegnis marinus]|uniref:Membrane domain of glycerophosphoryl diester phosphodiesterase n=1 Tax=Halosegnis marinus TaxID=3034023 RepID=A0ABD5ZKV1_9EURY|nr:hypothetical protein [Halosegnis sp. DT85]
MDGATALVEALRELRGRVGAALAALFLAVGVATVVARETLLAAAVGDATLRPALVEQYRALGVDPATIEANLATMGDTPLALGLSYGGSLLLFLAVALVAEYAAVVALRAVTGDGLRAAATRRVGRAVAVGFLVGVLVRGLVAVGLAAFVLPGVFLAVSLLFAHAAIAVDDAGPVEALSTAWGLAAGRRFEVLGVVSLLLALYLSPRLLAATVPGTPGLLLGGVAIGLGNLLSAGVVGRAYVAARDGIEGEGNEDGADDADPYDAPLGADDLPEPE